MSCCCRLPKDVWQGTAISVRTRVADPIRLRHANRFHLIGTTLVVMEIAEEGSDDLWPCGSTGCSSELSQRERVLRGTERHGRCSGFEVGHFVVRGWELPPHWLSYDEPPRRARTRCNVAPDSRPWSCTVFSSFLWVRRGQMFEHDTETDLRSARRTLSTRWATMQRTTSGTSHADC